MLFIDKKKKSWAPAVAGVTEIDREACNAVAIQILGWMAAPFGLAMTVSFEQRRSRLGLPSRLSGVRPPPIPPRM
jgi:hypothetical protein